MDPVPGALSPVFGIAVAISGRLTADSAATPVMAAPHSSGIPVARPGPEAAGGCRLRRQPMERPVKARSGAGRNLFCGLIPAPLFARHELPLTAKTTGGSWGHSAPFAAAMAASL